ncbi:TPA: hypothetical protein ACOJPH_003647 [Vibrio campbellii]|uniref:hypothetical protein n=1 Tax=Vibrio campbellii TaxID=680 RepID=UPI003908ED72
MLWKVIGDSSVHESDANVLRLMMMSGNFSSDLRLAKTQDYDYLSEQRNAFMNWSMTFESVE